MPGALNQRKGQVMQHLVQMKITPQARPANDEEGLKFANNLIYPTLKRCEQLQQEGKILAGGPISGTIGLALVVETDTLKELDQLLTSLRVWPRMETTVTPLTTFADRASAVEARLKRHQEEKALTADSES
jgi:muconolactone delta-isomerase